MNLSNEELIYKNTPVTKLFFKCAIPGVLSMFAASIYIITDGIFIGKYSGEFALSCINFAMPVLMITFSLAELIASGASVQVSIALGKEDYKKANSIFSFSVLLIFIFSVLAGIFIIFFSVPFFELLGADETYAKGSADYMLMFALFAPLVMFSFSFDNFLRISGKIKKSLYISITSSFLNIIFDYIFIVIFNMGIKGASLASCISFSISAILCIWPFLKNKLILKFEKPVFNFYILKNIIFNGSSSFFSMVSSSFLNVIINTAILNLYGEISIAAFGIVMYLKGLIDPILFAMNDSLQPAISYNYGSGNIKRTLGIQKRSWFFGFLICLLFFILCIFFGGFLVGLFMKNNNTELFNMALNGLYITTFTYLFSFFVDFTSSFLTSLNFPFYSFLISFCNSLFLPAILIFFCVKIFGFNGFWYSTLFSTLICFFISLFIIFKVIKNIFRQDFSEHKL